MEEQNISTKKLDKNKKIILTVIAVLILCVGSTLAYIIASLQDEARGNASVTSDAVDILRFEVDKDISLNPTQFNVVEGGDNLSDTAVGSAILRANSTNDNATYSYYVYFQINSNNYIYTTEDEKPEIILTITDPTGSPVTSVDGLIYVESLGGFDITTKSGLYTVAGEYPIISTSSDVDTIQDWTFTVTFINLDTNQYENGGKSLEAEVILSREPVYTLASYITNELYTGIDGDNGLYYHDGVGSYANADQEAGDYSYRYAGANPDNYVCFGTDEEICSNDNLYRIIGVFDNEVKLIKYDYITESILGISSTYDNIQGGSGSLDGYRGNLSIINNFHWDDNGSNIYSSTTLNIALNNGFLSSLGTWNNLITTHTYEVGGMPFDNTYTYTVKQIYNIEVDNNSNSITYDAKIGLMYVSDYGYAAFSNSWTTNMRSYSSTIDNNWMYMGGYDWTISCVSDYWKNSSYIVTSDGNVHDSDRYYGSDAVRPVFYLNSNVTYSSGDGSINNPYRIEI